MAKNTYFSSVIVLRGLAALIVGLFHFTKGFSHDESPMKLMTENGWMGVEVFFVISGFVIPYSLLRKNYHLKNYGKFLLKRIIRIHPAFIISVFIILILNYLSTLFDAYQGAPFEFSILLFIQHFFYAVEFFDNIWLNPVYWTLAVEFHYYLLIGVLIAIWNTNKTLWIAMTFLLFIALSFLKIEDFNFFNYTDIFGIGVLCAFLKRNFINTTLYMVGAIGLGLLILYNHGLILAFLTVFTSLIIAFKSNLVSKGPLIFLGNISYSLYLLHVPIGGRIINIAKRFDLSEPTKVIVILFAMSVSIFAAWIFYIYVEKPSHKWSQRFSLNASS